MTEQAGRPLSDPGAAAVLSSVSEAAGRLARHPYLQEQVRQFASRKTPEGETDILEDGSPTAWGNSRTVDEAKGESIAKGPPVVAS